MQSPGNPAARHYRHSLQTLTYVTLDEGNGGIVRNLSQHGVAVQAVGALRLQQRVRLRFELRFPRLPIDTYGQVSWANSSGQCGIRFTDIPDRTRQKIGEWLFTSLLDISVPPVENPGTEFGTGSSAEYGADFSRDSAPAAAQDGLKQHDGDPLDADAPWHVGAGKFEKAAFLSSHPPDRPQATRLSELLSGWTLSWLIDGLVLIAALCLFVLTFLAIAHELPPWRMTLGAVLVVSFFLTAAYWTISFVSGGLSLGARLLQAVPVSKERLKNEVPELFQ